jgi:hypothetical protein
MIDLAAPNRLLAMNRVQDAKIGNYTTLLLEPSRSSSKGGDGRAWHAHRITIDGQHYSWKGLGFRQWIYKSDTVSFEWQYDPTGKYRNVEPDSVRVTDTHGKEVERGERGTKAWRSATQGAPVSRREWNRD